MKYELSREDLLKAIKKRPLSHLKAFIDDQLERFFETVASDQAKNFVKDVEKLLYRKCSKSMQFLKVQDGYDADILYQREVILAMYDNLYSPREAIVFFKRLLDYVDDGRLEVLLIREFQEIDVFKVGEGLYSPESKIKVKVLLPYDCDYLERAVSAHLDLFFADGQFGIHTSEVQVLGSEVQPKMIIELCKDERASDE